MSKILNFLHSFYEPYPEERGREPVFRPVFKPPIKLNFRTTMMFIYVLINQMSFRINLHASVSQSFGC